MLRVQPFQSLIGTVSQLAPDREGCLDLILAVGCKQQSNNLLQGLRIANLRNLRLHPGQRVRKTLLHKKLDILTCFFDATLLKTLAKCLWVFMVQYMAAQSYLIPKDIGEYELYEYQIFRASAPICFDHYGWLGHQSAQRW